MKKIYIVQWKEKDSLEIFEKVGLITEETDTFLVIASTESLGNYIDEEKIFKTDILSLKECMIEDDK